MFHNDACNLIQSRDVSSLLVAQVWRVLSKITGSKFEAYTTSQRLIYEGLNMYLYLLFSGFQSDIFPTVAIDKS